MNRSGNPNTEHRHPKEARNPDSGIVSRHSGDLDFGNRVSDFMLWQLADSAFPTGGFAHSAGLETAWQYGEVGNRSELVSYVEASLQQLGRAALPFVRAAHAEPERVKEFDQLCDAFMTNHVANRASRAQGKAFLTAVERAFFRGQASSPSKNSLNRDGNMETGRMPVLRYYHFACVFGAATTQLGVSRETAARLFFFNHLRGTLAAAIRLNIVGPMEAQAIQHQFTPTAESALERSVALTLDDIAQTSPLLELWQGSQDRLYSRLFQS